MSYRLTCDYCGDEIDRDAPYVTINIKGDHSTERWSSGYIGHYHSAVDGCWERVYDALTVVHDAGPGIRRLATTSAPRRHAPASPAKLPDSALRGMRLVQAQHRDRVAAREPGGIGCLNLSRQAFNALVKAGVTRIAELRARLDDGSIFDIDMIGATRVRELRRALEIYDAGPVA